MIFYIKKSLVKGILFLSAISILNTVFADQTADNKTDTATTTTSTTEAEQQEKQPEASTSSKCTPKPVNILFQVGGFQATQGYAQHIGIKGLIGDRFTVTKGHDQNFLLGLGYYFLDGQEEDRIRLMYGVNAFYLGHTTVEGYVIQENTFTNLAYSYSLTNYPIYAAVRALIKTCCDKYTVTLDLGLGPNIIKTTDFTEKSLEGGITIPEKTFSGETRVAFSATLGIGVRFYKLFGCYPLEFGYRFFYLGQGQLSKGNNQVLNSLSTGNNYANALVFTISEATSV